MDFNLIKRLIFRHKMKIYKLFYVIILYVFKDWAFCMEKENLSEEKWTNKRYLRLLIGVLIICLSVFGISNFTILGQFITYSFSFLFGIFYPLILSIIILIGLLLVFCNHISFKKNVVFYIVGFILLLLSMLSLGSKNIFDSNSTMKFTESTSVFKNQMLSFSRYPFVVDDFSCLGNLGGGIIGLVCYSLLASLWGSTLTCTFYSLLLFIGVLFFLYQPISLLIQEVKKRKLAKVEYDSPNKKGKATIKPVVRNDKQIFDNIEIRDNNPVVTEEVKKTSIQAEFSSSRYGNSFNQYNKIEEEPKPKVDEIEEYKKSTLNSNVNPLVEKDVADDVNLSRQGFFKTNSYTSNKKVEKVEEESKPLTIDDIKLVKKTDEEKPVEIVEPIVEPKPVEIKTQKPDFNPLERQAENVKNIVKSEPVQNEINIDYSNSDDEVIQSDEDEMEFEETDEERIERLFFEMKERKENKQKSLKEQEKQARLSSVMKYVSDKPRVYSYNLPNDDLLEEQDSGDKLEENKQAALGKAEVINRVFQDFHFPAKAVSFTIGASVTRFNIQTEPGVKADKIESLLSELQRALNGDQSVRIQTVVEGKSTSGVELGNAKQMPVSFKSVFQEIEKDTKNNLLLPIGKDISGNIITYPLNEMPHLLVAGTTGSGKSVLVNCMIMTLIMRNYPSQLKLMLIDPKQVEFAKYNMEPHLLCPVIQDTDSAVVALKKLVDEMERRYSLLREYNVVKISEYRKKQLDNPMMEELPDIAVFIDEFADLMNTGGDMIEESVQRLTQKSRAAGIYLCIATQRPSKEALPMLIKANIICRVGLSCSSQVDSRVILDENGCETLVGKGDLLFKCPGKRSLLRCQSPYISDEEMDKVLDYVREEAGNPNYNKDFIDLQVENETEDSETIKTLDQIFDDVKEYVMCTGICSRSHIMNFASLSASKADQMITRLKNVGIIKSAPGGKNVVVIRKKIGD